jgi:hypothetical protein
MVMTREQINELRERLQASRVELLTDIAAREEQLATDHDAIIETTRRAPAREVVFKVHRANGNGSTGNGSGNGGTIGDDNGSIDAPPLNDEQLDILAQAIAELRAEFLSTIEAAIAPLREELAELRGQVGTILALLGNGNGGAKALGRKPRLLPPTQ